MQEVMSYPHASREHALLDDLHPCYVYYQVSPNSEYMLYLLLSKSFRSSITNSYFITLIYSYFVISCSAHFLGYGNVHYKNKDLKLVY